jgi:hypothetical protein
MHHVITSVSGDPDLVGGRWHRARQVTLKLDGQCPRCSHVFGERLHDPLALAETVLVHCLAGKWVRAPEIVGDVDIEKEAG